MDDVNFRIGSLQAQMFHRQTSSSSRLHEADTDEGDDVVHEESESWAGVTAVNFIVTHGSEEVTVEVKSSQSVLDVKKKAHEQLSLWLRFNGCLLGEDEEGRPVVPALADCRLYAAEGDEAVPLREGRRVSALWLENGARLWLRRDSELFEPYSVES